MTKDEFKAQKKIAYARREDSYEALHKAVCHKLMLLDLYVKAPTTSDTAGRDWGDVGGMAVISERLSGALQFLGLEEE